MNRIKSIFRIEYLKNFEIVLEYFQVCEWKTALWEKKKTLVLYRVCITKRPREIYDRFLNKKSDILRLFECFQLSESTACWQKRRCDRIVALCILLKKRPSYPYRCKDVLPLFGRNSSLFDIYTKFYLSASPSQTRVTEFIFLTTAIFTEIWRCSSWKRCTFI